MPRPVQEPVETGQSLDKDGKQYEHPAFGQIGASRVQGRHVLYGSDFVHNSFIRIHISRSQLNRSLSRDWHFGKKELIAVDLSEAQWATFVSAMNVGTGVPCTIDHVQGEIAPAIPHRTEHAEFKNEVRARMGKATTELDKLSALVETMGLSKAKAAQLQAQVRMASMQINANLPFVADSFDEHVEQKVEKAKVELHGYMTHLMMSAGAQAIANATPPLELDYAPEEREPEDEDYCACGFIKSQCDCGK